MSQRHVSILSMRPSRSEVIRAAIVEEIARQSAALDSLESVRAVTIIAKLRPSGTVRAVILTPEVEREFS